LAISSNGGHGENRAENLLLSDTHAWLDVGVDSGQDIVPLRQVPIGGRRAAHHPLGALFLGDLPVLLDLLELSRSDDGAEVLRRLQGGDDLCDASHEVIVDRPLDEQPDVRGKDEDTAFLLAVIWPTAG
jgi:hypothetical protein